MLTSSDCPSFLLYVFSCIIQLLSPANWLFQFITLSTFCDIPSWYCYWTINTRVFVFQIIILQLIILFFRARSALFVSQYWIIILQFRWLSLFFTINFASLIIFSSFGFHFRYCTVLFSIIAIFIIRVYDICWTMIHVVQVAALFVLD